MKHFVYILQCADGTFYTGVTKNLQERLNRHNRGRGGRYTKGRNPVMLVYYELSNSLKCAMTRERQIRCLPRPKKQKLITQFEIERKALT